MRRVALALACAGLLAGAAGAQEDEDSSACANACYDSEDLCYEACSDEGNASVCEDECREQAEACLAQCE